MKPFPICYNAIRKINRSSSAISVSQIRAIILICLCLGSIGSAFSQTFAYVDSYLLPGQKVKYGVKGVYDAANHPGYRSNAACWRTADGTVYIFGGSGYNETAKGQLNDLWKYNPLTNQWAWVHGSKETGSTAVYGTKGTAGANNTPGARTGTITWADSAGNLYLFGGYGWIGTSVGYFNELWRYNPVTNQWTWLKGTDALNPTAVYGSQGASAAANTPGGRADGVGYTGADGSLYLFAGTGYTATDNGRLNDMWKYNPQNNQWTWLKGSDQRNQSGNYGTLGVAAAANTPGGRFGCVGWRGADGLLYMFGGEGHSSGTSVVSLNDLWSYNTSNNQWTWIKGSATGNEASVYGSQGVSATANKPGSRRYGTTWTGSDGSLYLFGGYGRGTNSTWLQGELGDFWKYSPATNQWTWIKGGTITGMPSVHGIMGVSASTNEPGSRSFAASWVNADGSLAMFGGYGSTDTINGTRNDLWQFSPGTNQWVWLKGHTQFVPLATYSAPGTADAGNSPGMSHNSMKWTGVDGSLYLFGGEGHTTENHGRLNDMWKYNPTADRWTWLKGTNLRDRTGVYGSLGVAAAGNVPGGRTGAFTWTHSDGSLYLFGGEGFAAAGLGALNDMWKYDPQLNLWTWLKGGSAMNQSGVYGTAGVAAPENTPGGRSYGAAWKGTDGSFYLFGGVGLASTGTGRLNDLWKYNPLTNQWTWLKGSNLTNQNGVYGTRGTASATNVPGSRSAVSAWIGTGGTFYLFGGAGLSTSAYGLMNDLWKYDVVSNQWTWLKGSNTRNQPGVYGTKGTPAAANTPGARGLCTAWEGGDGKLYLFGGQSNPTAEDEYRNDLWRYDSGTNDWTWINGSQTANVDSIIGTPGQFNTANMPSSRTGAAAWKDQNGTNWLFGGGNNKYDTEHKDMWKFQAEPTSSVDLWMRYR